MRDAKIPVPKLVARIGIIVLLALAEFKGFKGGYIVAILIFLWWLNDINKQMMDIVLGCHTDDCDGEPFFVTLEEHDPPLVQIRCPKCKMETTLCGTQKVAVYKWVNNEVWKGRE